MALGKQIEKFAYVFAGVLAMGIVLLTIVHMRWQDQRIAGLEALTVTVVEPHELEDVPVEETGELFLYFRCGPDMGIVPDSDYRWAAEGLNPTQPCVDL